MTIEIGTGTIEIEPSEVGFCAMIERHGKTHSGDGSTWDEAVGNLVRMNPELFHFGTPDYINPMPWP